MQQGLLEGLFEVIELGLELKFGVKGMQLMPIIRKIKDTDRLKAIKVGVKVAKDISELEEMIGN